MRPNGVITLATDFGTRDSYVGIMKGVILGIAPHAQIVDVTHDITPQDIHEAAYTAQTYYPYFPEGTVHVLVVDPGVGSRRGAIVLETPQAWFVAPDNGALTYVWRDACARWSADHCRIIQLTEARYWLADVSSTFHGRDIFSPVAAHLLNQVAAIELGSVCTTLVEADLEQPGPSRHGGLAGRIIHIDHFGNCITNITMQHLGKLPSSANLAFEIIGQRIYGLHRTYADVSPGELLVLLGSNDRLEISVSNGNAAQSLGVGVGDTVRVFALENQP